MKNNADKNNTRELNLQVCSEIHKLEFSLYFFFLTLKRKGKNEQVNHKQKFKKIFAWKRMHQVLNRHFTVQNSLLLEAFARHPFHFPKHCFITPHFHEPSMAVSGRYWGTGGKSCNGVSPLVKDMMLAGHSHSSLKVQQGPEQDSGRLS